MCAMIFLSRIRTKRSSVGSFSSQSQSATDESKRFSYSRADGFIWQSYLPSSFETEENWRLSRPFFFFFFFLCEKNLTRKMTREWTKSKERNWSNSTFLSFFLFFFLFIKKITMKRLSFESKTIRLMETCRFNIPRHSSQSSIVREIKITGSA